jgi:hypothetical protein
MIVKRNGGKVILKGGKVSCSCCEAEECCMYPADKFGVTYTEDDLPQTLIDFGAFNNEDNDTDIYLYTKLSEPVDFPDGLVQHYSNNNGEGIYNRDGVHWFGEDTDTTFCLLGGGSVYVDQFPDELSVTIPNEFGNENPVFRRDICIWNDDQGVCELVELFFDSSVS